MTQWGTQTHDLANGLLCSRATKSFGNSVAEFEYIRQSCQGSSLSRYQAGMFDREGWPAQGAGSVINMLQTWQSDLILVKAIKREIRWHTSLSAVKVNSIHTMKLDCAPNSNPLFSAPIFPLPSQVSTLVSWFSVALAACSPHTCKHWHAYTHRRRNRGGRVGQGPPNILPSRLY